MSSSRAVFVQWHLLTVSQMADGCGDSLRPLNSCNSCWFSSQTCCTTLNVGLHIGLPQVGRRGKGWEEGVIKVCGEKAEKNSIPKLAVCGCEKAFTHRHLTPNLHSFFFLVLFNILNSATTTNHHHHQQNQCQLGRAATGRAAYKTKRNNNLVSCAYALRNHCRLCLCTYKPP